MHAAVAKTFVDQRAFGRRESCIHATVYVAGRQSLPCIVRNFSEQGALLEFAEPISTPFTFRLFIDSKNVETLCEVRHQKNNAIGVRFLGTGVAAVLEQELARTTSQRHADGTSVQNAPQRQASRVNVVELRRSMFGPRT